MTPELPQPGTDIRIGVAGWSYPDWEGIVYPKSAAVDGLAFLARYFDTLEVNSPFYRIPSSRATASWARRVAFNERFRFTVKLYRGFTHDRRWSPEDARAFREALAPLKESRKLGALLVQLPWSFKNEEGSCRYLARLLECFEDVPRVVELRHLSWNTPELREFLHERQVGFCNIDQPVIGRSLPPTAHATSPLGYVRLHGRNVKDWFREGAGRDARYDYLYSGEELEPWIDKISEISEKASETYVITNNHFRGQAVVNALQIKARLGRTGVAAPASLVEHYPVLKDVVTAEGPVQGSLF